MNASQISQSKSYRFREEIRRKQIQQYKCSVRAFYPLIINYAQPSTTISHLEELILLDGIPYLPEALQFIHSIIDNYQLCKLIAKHKILQQILLIILQEDTLTDYQQKKSLLKLYLFTIQQCVRNWANLWEEMCGNLEEVLWGILADFYYSGEIVEVVGNLLITLNIRIESLNSIPYIAELLDKIESPAILNLVAESIDQKIVNQQELSEKIISKAQFLTINSMCQGYLKLLTKLQFLNEETLVRIHQNCLNLYDQNPTKLALKILYQQMHLTDSEVMQYAVHKGNQQIIIFVKELLQNDY